MTDTVASQSKAVQDMAEAWPMLDALLGGTLALRKASVKYLPKWPNEAGDSYITRLATATLYPAFRRTVEILASKPFSKATTLSDNTPPNIIEWCDDIDQQGRNLQSFLSEVMKDCIGHGISGVLVDYPPKADTIKTLEQERNAGLRPYFVHYPPGTVLGWRTEHIGGRDRLVQLRLKETIIEPDGEFGEKEVKQIRVLTPGAWETWRESSDKKAWAVYESGVTSLTEIPFVAMYGNREGFMIGSPPLLELAYQNIEHFQSSSDQQTITHVARVPILTIIGGEPNKPITVGASTAIELPIGASLQFVEHSGAAIGAGRQSLLDLEERMRQTGAELLVLQPGAVTATQVQSENEGNRCALQRIVENFEDAADQCLQFMADWVGEPEGGNVSLFKDFGVASLSDASAQMLLTASTMGLISGQTYIAEMKRRGVLAPEVEWEEEQNNLNNAQTTLQGQPLPVTPPPETPPEPAPVTPAEPIAPHPDTVAAMDAMKAQMMDVSTKMDNMKPADLKPIEDKIAALSTKVDSIPEPVDQTATITKVVADQLAKVPEAVTMSQMQEALRAAVAAIPAPVAPVHPPQSSVVVLDNKGALVKTITLTHDAQGNATGATVTETPA